MSAVSDQPAPTIDFEPDPFFTVERIQDFFAKEWPKKRAALGGFMLFLTIDRPKAKSTVEGMGFESGKEMMEAAADFKEWLEATIDIMENVEARILIAMSDAFDEPDWFEKLPRN